MERELSECFRATLPRAERRTTGARRGETENATTAVQLYVVILLLLDYRKDIKPKSEQPITNQRSLDHVVLQFYTALQLYRPNYHTAFFD